MHCFYAEEATMRENMAQPRSGKPALIQHEQDALAGVKNLQAKCIRPFFIEGDFVVIRWLFEIEDIKGKRFKFEELSHQRWVGQQIMEEQFFYDPSQLTESGAQVHA